MSYVMEPWEEKIELARAIKYHLFSGRNKAPCMWCATLLDFDKATIEHVVPQSKGGPWTVENCAIACQSCNQKRGNRTVEDFNSSPWLEEKRRQVNSQLAKDSLRRPTHHDGTPMSDEEILHASFLFLNCLGKRELVSLLMGMGKPGHINNFARRFMDM